MPMRRYLDRTAAVLVGGCALYAAVSIPLYAVTRFFLPVAMGWNLFLAGLPLVFATLAAFWADRGKKALAGIAAALWLLFFPNAPYLLTDLIHLNTFQYYAASGYARDIRAWFWLAYVALGVVLGMLTGMLSLYGVHGRLLKKGGPVAAGLVLGGVALLSGYGIYIGRFLRFNSWSVLRPVSLLGRLASDFGPFTIWFTLLMAAVILVGYGIFYLLYARRDIPKVE